MSTIFISHSSSDNALASELGRRLEQQNHHSVFLDLDPEKGIVAGQSWEQTLYRKLRACRAVVALCTDHYLNSQWCFAELALARMEGKHIIALQVDPLSESSRLPAILTDKQFIDLRSNAEEGYERLWKGLEAQDLLGVAGEWDPKKPPYLGLNAYQEEDAPVFFGREDESQAGLELLSRGAPGLIMVLGASGSGKSSLVRAGMLPRLRLEESQWLVVDPFRPGQDPFSELAESLAQTCRRYAPEHAARVGSAEQIRGRLHGWTPPSSCAEPQTDSAEAAPAPAADQRLTRLIQHIEELRDEPPAPAAAQQERLRDFLDWSLDDLRRISGECALPAAAMAAENADTPLVDLARDLQRASGRRDARVLLIVDQFEEMLGREGADVEVNRFLSLLRASLEAEHGPLMALGTMRSDFLGAFQRNPELRGIDFESLSLGPMRLDGMRRVIEEPAKLGALELETGLADRLIEDTETPDALPLLSFTLSVLWRDCRQDGKVEVHEYEALGGLNGAIAGEADALLALAEKEGKQEALRKAFLRMARLTEEGSYARQPVEWEAEELRPVHAILESFVERRLLVARSEGETRNVEMAHEALLRSWKPLATWLENDRGELLLRQQLKRDAEAWQESGRAAESLWRGGRLEQSRELLRKGELEGTERAFVRGGLLRRLVRRGTIAGLTLVGFAAVAWFLVQAQDAARRAEDSLRMSVAQRWLDQEPRDPTRAALVLAELERPDEVRHAVAYMQRALSEPLASVWISGHRGALNAASFSQDGKRVLTASDDGTARVWNAADGSPVLMADGQPVVLPEEGPILRAWFTANDTQVVTASMDRVRLWQADGSNHDNPRDLYAQPDQFIWSAALSPDSRQVAVIVETAKGLGVAVFAADPSGGDGPRLLMAAQPWSESHLPSIFFSTDGTRLLALLTESLWVWSVEGWDPIEPAPSAEGLISAAIGPQGSRVVATGWSSSEGLWTKMWSLDQPSEDEPWVLQFVPPDRPHDAIWAASFDPDGRLLGTLFFDGTFLEWDVLGFGPPQRSKSSLCNPPEITDGYGEFGVDSSMKLRQMSWPRRLVDIFFNGESLVARCGGPTVSIFGGAEPLTLEGHTKPVSVTAFDPVGERVLTASEDGTARIWPLVSLKPDPPRVIGPGTQIASASFGPDGTRVLTTSWDGVVRVWKVDGSDENEPAGLPLGSWEPSRDSASLSQDNARVLTLSGGVARVWRVDGMDRESPVVLAHPLAIPAAEPSASASFSPDGTRVVTGALDGTVRVWMADGSDRDRPLLLEGHTTEISAASFSPGETRVLAGGTDGTLRLWMADGSNRDEPHLLRGHETGITAASFGPHGAQVLAGAGDGTTRIWVIDGPKKGQTVVLESPAKVDLLKGWEANPIRAAAFSPDGTRVAVGAEDGTVRIWMADGSDWEAPVVFEPPAAIKEEGEESVPGIVALWFSRPDGTHVLTRWDDGRVRRSMADGSDKDFPVLHAGQDARFGAEGLLLLEPLESGAGLRNVDGVQLQQAIRAATRVCLEPSFRRIDLGESEQEARKRYEACQARASEALQAE